MLPGRRGDSYSQNDDPQQFVDLRIVLYLLRNRTRSTIKAKKKKKIDHMVDKERIKNCPSLSKHGKFTCNDPFLTKINSSSIRALSMTTGLALKLANMERLLNKKFPD